MENKRLLCSLALRNILKQAFTLQHFLEFLQFYSILLITYSLLDKFCKLYRLHLAFRIFGWMRLKLSFLILKCVCVFFFAEVWQMSSDYSTWWMNGNTFTLFWNLTFHWVIIRRIFEIEYFSRKVFLWYAYWKSLHS